jgi:alpha galactosidase C-like protein
MAGARAGETLEEDPVSLPCSACRALRSRSKRQLDFRKQRYQIRDLWAHRDIGNTARTLTGSVAPHDVWMLRLQPL